MKVLRAIGGFFAKIGRWIANTAWIQPLLIVGGIFGIIFSIPYIKDAIEKASVDNTDYDYAYYSGKALSLEKDGQADRLFGYLENEETDKIDEEFGKQFFVTFVKETCDYCKECVDGFQEFENKFSSYTLDDEGTKLENSFKLYTILVDKADDDGKYYAKQRYDDHKDFFDRIVGTFADTRGANEYALYKTLPSKASDIKSKLEKMLDATSSVDGEIDTPFTFMYDSKMAEDNTRINESGVSAVFFNYVDLVTANEKNAYTKGLLLRDCWSYTRVFDPTYEEAND